MAKAHNFREDRAMKKAVAKKTSRKGKRAARSVTGKPIATLGDGMYVVRTKSGRIASVARSSDRAGVLVARLGKALSKPGISRRAIFGDTKSDRVYSYSVYGADPSKIVRESVKGKRTIGRVIGGKFRAR